MQNEDMTRFDIFMKYLSITLIFLMFFSLFLKHVQNETRPHVVQVEEWIDSNYTDFVMRHPDREKLVEAINYYTKDNEKSQEFATLIFGASFNHKIDHWLIASIIAKESSFNKRAKSYVHARGLMQIMPQWHDVDGSMKWIPSKRNPDNLYDPAVNIEYGTKIIKLYITKYNGNKLKALPAYNGSKGSLKYPLAVNSIFTRAGAPQLL